MPTAVDYYISLNSPWTYLGSARFRDMARRYKIAVNVKPARFSDVFAQTGGLPLPKRSPQRQAYRLMELKRWRDHLGIPITIEPKYFPADEQLGVRLVTAAAAQGLDALSLSHEIGKAVWEREEDIGVPATLAAAAGRAGLDADAIRRTGPPDAELDATWERNTAEAVAIGVFGAPSWVLPSGEVFWGQDRLEFVERALQKLT
jgi:2-hydroxychromene-2-carboxylate isomerase